MLLGAYYTLPIMLALCLMLLGTYYAQNYAGIISRSLFDIHGMSIPHAPYKLLPHTTKIF